MATLAAIPAPQIAASDSAERTGASSSDGQHGTPYGAVLTPASGGPLATRCEMQP